MVLFRPSAPQLLSACPLTRSIAPLRPRYTRRQGQRHRKTDLERPERAIVDQLRSNDSPSRISRVNRPIGKKKTYFTRRLSLEKTSLNPKPSTNHEKLTSPRLPRGVQFIAKKTIPSLRKKVRKKVTNPSSNPKASPTDYQRIKTPRSPRPRFGPTDNPVSFRTLDVKKSSSIPGPPSADRIPRRYSRPPAPQAAKTPSLSIYEELFPQEAAADLAANSPNKKQPAPPPPEIPTDILRSGVRISYHDFGTGQVSLTPSFDPATKDNHHPPHRAAVLVFHAASPSLTEADFRRTAPRLGKHLPEWSGGRGNILKVVASRGLQSLAPHPRYFLLFENVQHAIIYRDHIAKCHRLAGEHAAATLTYGGSRAWRKLRDSAKRAEADEEKEGEQEGGNTPSEDPITREEAREERLVANYRLLPPSQPQIVKVLLAPFTTQLNQIVKYDGYKLLTRSQADNRTEDRQQGRRNLARAIGQQGSKREDTTNTAKEPPTEPKPIDRSSRTVRFGFAGCHTYGLVSSVLQADGKARGLPWNCTAERLVSSSHNDVDGGSSYSATNPVSDDGDDGFEDEDIASESAFEREEAQLKFLRKTRGRVWWVLTFPVEDDARRFVRWWHGRVVPLGRDIDETRAVAELLW